MSNSQGSSEVSMSSGWKSFEELQSKYSPAEIKFEKGRRSIGLWLGPLVFILILLMGTPEGMTEAAKQVLAITAWTVIWWVCEPIPLPATGLVPFILIPAMGIMDANAIFSVLGHQNNFLMIGAYIFIGCLVQHGFTKRLALWLLSRDFAAKSPLTLLVVFSGAVALLSTVLSNIPCTMLFLVIGAGMSQALNIEENHPFSKALKFGAAYGSQAGGLFTPIGSPNVNFLTMGLILSLVEYNIRFADWMLVGVPFGILIFIITMIYFRAVFNIKIENIGAASAYAKEELAKLGKMKPGERNGLFLIALAIVLWLIPSIAAAVLGNTSPVTQQLDTLLNGAIVALIAAVLAFVLPVDWKERKFTTNWTQAERSINWGAIVIVTTGFGIGNAMNAENVKLIGFIAKKMSGFLGDSSHIVIILGFVIVGTVLTQFISNVPATSILTTVGIPVAIASGMNPIALAFTLSMACQMSYALPIAAPQMALMYGSGGVKITEFFKIGAILSLISIPVVSFTVYYWANFLFPYMPQ